MSAVKSKLTRKSYFIIARLVILFRDANSKKMLLSYLPTPPLWQNMTQGQFLSGD